jgi:hypothetical protein
LELKKQGQKWKADSVTVTWIVCWLHRVFPNTGVPGWENFECSHRCLCGGTGNLRVCLLVNHLVWESKHDNCSRGYKICFRKCEHCGLCLCVCQGIHKTPLFIKFSDTLSWGTVPYHSKNVYVKLMDCVFFDKNAQQSGWLGVVSLARG